MSDTVLLLSPLLLSNVVRLLSITNILRIRCVGSVGEEAVLICISGSQIPLVASLPYQSHHFNDCDSSLYAVRVPVSNLKSILAVPAAHLTPLPNKGVGGGLFPLATNHNDSEDDASAGGSGSSQRPGLSLFAKLTTTMKSIHLEVNFAAAIARCDVDWVQPLLLDTTPPTEEATGDDADGSENESWSGAAGLTEALIPPTHTVSNGFALNWAGSGITFKRAEQIGSIGKNFLKNAKFLSVVNFGMSEEDHDNYGCRGDFARYSTFKNVVFIGDGFLFGASLLTAVNLTGLFNVTTIASNFMEGCNSLEKIDLSPFCSVVSFGDSFLANCLKLQVVNLTSLATTLKSLGDKFCFGCQDLRVLETDRDEQGIFVVMQALETIGSLFASKSGLQEFSTVWLGRSVTSVGDGFLSRCSHLQHLEMTSGLQQVHAIGADFLLKCTSLKNMRMCPRGLKAVALVGDNFMRETAARRISLVLPSMRSLGSGFLMECTNLEEAVLGRGGGVSQLTAIRDNFMAKCPSLKYVDLGVIGDTLSSVGSGFLSGSTALQSFRFGNNDSNGPDTPQPPWSSLAIMGDDFLASSSINTFSFAPFTNLSRVGNNCLAGSMITTIITAHNMLTHLVQIGDGFASNCEHLETVSLAGFNRVTTIGSSFMRGCSSLTDVDLSPLSNVTIVGAFFLHNCRSLRDVDISPIRNLISHQPHLE